jgi:hypothetical protein
MLPGGTQLVRQDRASRGSSVSFRTEPGRCVRDAMDPAGIDYLCQVWHNTIM